MKFTAFCFISCLACSMAMGQEAVSIQTPGGKMLRGKIYRQNITLPFIILCIPENTGGDKLDQIARRLLHLKHNCLAVDVTDPADINAAIAYVRHFNLHPVVLFGTTRSASLCLLSSLNNPLVKAVVAFSPGEYFLPRINVSDAVKGINKPVFIAFSDPELPYLEKLTAGISPQWLTLFKPENNNGVQGVGALVPGESSDEYWFALLMFFKKVTSDE